MNRGHILNTNEIKSRDNPLSCLKAEDATILSVTEFPDVYAAVE